MENNIKTVKYDNTLKIEAFCFEGIIQPFPNHFHNYYTFGFVKSGERTLICNNSEYLIKEGDMLFLNPKDCHTCKQKDNGSFSYFGLNINKEVMALTAKDFIGVKNLPVFLKNVIQSKETAQCFCNLYDAVVVNSDEFKKEENFLLFISHIIQNYTKSLSLNSKDCRLEIETVCNYMENNYRQKLSLNALCKVSGLKKSTLLRYFIKQKGITPYRYLESIRINAAKTLLEKGYSSLGAAVETGFFDQSHFANCFSATFGFAPKIYKENFLNKAKGS